MSLPHFDLCEFLAKKWHRKMGHKISYDELYSSAMFGYSKYYSTHSDKMIKNQVWSSIEWQIINDIRSTLGRKDKTKQSKKSMAFVINQNMKSFYYHFICAKEYLNENKICDNRQ